MLGRKKPREGYCHERVYRHYGPSWCTRKVKYGNYCTQHAPKELLPKPEVEFIYAVASGYHGKPKVQKLAVRKVTKANYVLQKSDASVGHAIQISKADAHLTPEDAIHAYRGLCARRVKQAQIDLEAREGDLARADLMTP